MAEVSEHPSTPDPVPTITLEEAVRMLAPHFKGDIYLIAEHVRTLVMRGDPNGVPAFNAGCGRIHPACFVNGMVAVSGRYDLYNGQPILEIAGLTNMNSWDWGPAANTLGRKEFEKHLSGVAQKASQTPPPVVSRLEELRQAGRINTERRKMIAAWARHRYPPHGDIPDDLTSARMADQINAWLKKQRKREINPETLRKACDRFLQLYRCKPRPAGTS
jgi:hypothetical protein